MDNRWDSYRNYISEQIKHENSLLFQRFNYFLLMTSFLIIAFVTIISSIGFTLDISYRIFWIAQIIVIVGIGLSYGFSIINFINARLIYDIGLFQKELEESWRKYSVPSFNFAFHVSHNLVPKHRFTYEYLWIIYFHTIAFLFRINPDSPSGKFESADYADSAPHTWLIPIFFSFLWTLIDLVTVANNRWLLLTLLIIIIISISSGLLMKKYYSCQNKISRFFQSVLNYNKKSCQV